jgi:tetratricopeptide (TPR) repeat protein
VAIYLYNLGLDESEERLRSALDEARRAVALAPGDPRAAAALALALASADRLTPALEEARRATSLAPESAEAHAALGIVLRLRKDVEGALAACRRAAGIAPNDPRILTALGDALREAGRHHEAMEMFGQATDLDHEAIAPQLGAAGTLLKSGSLPSARGLYNLLLQDWDYGENRTRLGAAALLVALHDYESALAIYDTLSLPAGSPLPALLALYGKGYCLTRLGRDAEAEYFFSSLLDRVPIDYDGPARGREILFSAYDDLIAYFRKRDRDRKVTALLRSACERPLVPTRLARALAERLDAAKETGEASSVLEKAILGSDPLEDPLELADSVLGMVRLRTAGGARRLPDGSAADRALDLASDRLRASEPGAVHYRLARALALAQRREAALDSLKRARQAGYLPADQMAGEPDFARILEDPAFQALLKQQP